MSGFITVIGGGFALYKENSKDISNLQTEIKVTAAKTESSIKALENKTESSIKALGDKTEKVMESLQKSVTAIERKLGITA